MPHAIESVPAPASSKPRARTLVRGPRRAEAAALFARVVDAAGGNCAAGRALDVHESVVRELRSGAVSVPLDKLLSLAADSQRAAEALAAEVQALVAPRSSVPPGLRAGRIAKECGEAALALVSDVMPLEQRRREMLEGRAEIDAGLAELGR